MPRINLLPWREEQRLQKNKEFISLVVMIGLLAGIAVGATLLFFNNKLSDQKAANQLITTENQKLDKALKEIETLEQRKEEITSRMKVIQDLQGKRPIPVRVWDDLARAVPEMLFLTKLERKGDQLVLSGKAENPNIVSALINNLDRSQWMGNSSVQFIEKGEDVKIPDRDSTEEIYPENSYIFFQVTTNIQMSTKEGEKVADAESEVTARTNGIEAQAGAGSTPPTQEAPATTSENSQVQASSDDLTVTNEAQTQQGQASDSGAKETKTQSQEPSKANDNQAPVKQEKSDKSQANDKVKPGDDASNASQDKTAESSDDTAKDSGGDT